MHFNDYSLLQGITFSYAGRNDALRCFCCVFIVAVVYVNNVVVGGSIRNLKQA